MKDKNKKLLNQEILQLRKLRGKERGADIKYLVEYVKEKEGENGLKALKIKLAEQYDFFLPNLDKVADIEWIPEVIPHIFLVSSARFFDWKEEDIYEMGKTALSYSKTIKIFLRYFTSTEKTIQRTADNWNEYYSEGSTHLISFDKENKVALLELRDFKTHPFICVYLRGVMAKILEIVTASKNAKVEETKCMFKGKPHHEFKLTW